MTEKLKNKEMEDIHFADEKKIEKLEKKLSNFHEAQEKIMLLEKNNQSFQKKIESLFEEKEILENNYKSYTMEIEKVCLSIFVYINVFFCSFIYIYI